MNIRKFLICAIASFAVASTSLVNAQEKKGRGMMTAEQRIEQIEQAVGSLSADQKKKISAVYASMAEKMQGLSQEERREKGMELMASARKDVRAILTPDQQKKFDAMPQGGRGGGGGKKKSEN
jgi:Spy/CpxP family protein refolding chaperone